MSFDTSTTWRGPAAPLPARARRRGSGCRPCRPAGLPAGRPFCRRVWKNRRPLRVLVAQLGQRDAVLDGIVVDVGDQRIERARHLARIARHFGHALLVVVEFFERHHRQIDVVFLEAEQRRRVVHQHVGVEHEQLAHLDLPAGRAGAACSARASAACGGWRGCGVGASARACRRRGSARVIGVRRRHRLRTRPLFRPSRLAGAAFSATAAALNRCSGLRPGQPSTAFAGRPAGCLVARRSAASGSFGGSNHVSS